jgi:RHS repeat-associated protein
MIRAGNSTIIVSRKVGGTNSVSYLTSDHLGSSSAITNSSGGILVNSSFDAFGKRRGANWSGSPSAADLNVIAATTRRGYTEHSMLDNLNLTHMNGRVYDQMLGRFLSADPFIPDPLNTQSYNRYSYVFNNPLSFTDPSGFVPEDPGPEIPEWEPHPSPHECYGSSSRYCDPDAQPEPGDWGGTGKPVNILESVGHWLGTSSCPKGVSSMATKSCNPDLGAAYRIGVWLSQVLDEARAEVFSSTGELIGPSGDEALEIVLQADWDDTSKMVVGTAVAMWTTDNASNTVAQSYNAAVLVVGTAVGAPGAGVRVAPSVGTRTGITNGVRSHGVVARGAAAESRALAPYFPTANGFIGATSQTTLQAGQVIDRYGGSAASRFFSPAGTPAAARALPPGTAAQGLRSFEVLKPFGVEAGQVAPAFNQIGLGMQYRSSMTLGELIDGGYLREIGR